MPQLLPQSISFYHADWVGPAGRLIWATLFTTASLLWVMMLMKKSAVKNKKLGPVIFIGGTLLGSAMAFVGKKVIPGTLAGGTFIPFGFMIAWFCFIAGLWTIILSIDFNPIKLPVTKKLHVAITFGAMVLIYVIGGFIHPITIAMVWLNVIVFLTSISLFVWALPKFENEATWNQAVLGGLASFALMGFIYAIIPHEFITFANSYLQWTKDAKLSAGGQFILKTWMEGHLWTSRTRIIPFEVNMEMVQDHGTIAIYVIAAIMNIRIFSIWQKRNDPTPVATSDETASVKKSLFGRPLRAMKASKA